MFWSRIYRFRNNRQCFGEEYVILAIISNVLKLSARNGVSDKNCGPNHGCTNLTAACACKAGRICKLRIGQIQITILRVTDRRK